MEKIYDESMIRRVQEYMETHKISQNQMASKVNISSAALSSYMNQKYKGSVETVERQLKEFFAIAEESAAAAAEKTGGLLPRESYIPTSISEDVPIRHLPVDALAFLRLCLFDSPDFL